MNAQSACFSSPSPKQICHPDPPNRTVGPERRDLHFLSLPAKQICHPDPPNRTVGPERRDLHFLSLLPNKFVIPTRPTVPWDQSAATFTFSLFCQTNLSSRPAQPYRGTRAPRPSLSLSSAKQICHPDRSVAKWRDLLCAFPSNQGPTSELANPAPAILFIRSG